MAANNSFTFVGNLTAESKMAKTTTGKEYTIISLAINSAKDKPDFISVFVWGKLAETIVKYCKKGDGIAVEGYVSTMNKDGKTSYLFNALDAKFLHKAKRNEEPKAEPAPALDPSNDNFVPVATDPFALI